MKWISLMLSFAVIAASGVVEFQRSIRTTQCDPETAPAAPAIKSLGAKVIGGTYEDSTCGLLTLNPVGNYYASESGQCGMPYGDAAGRWSATKTTLTLTPTTEHGAMRDGLRTLDIVDLGERLIFLRPSDRTLFKQSGIKRVSCFQREDQVVDNDLVGLFVRGHSNRQLRSEHQP